MKVEIPLMGRPEINLALIFEDVQKKSDKMLLNLVQRGSTGKKHVQIGVVSKSDLKRLAKSC